MAKKTPKKGELGDIVRAAAAQTEPGKIKAAEEITRKLKTGKVAPLMECISMLNRLGKDSIGRLISSMESSKWDPAVLHITVDNTGIDNAVPDAEKARIVFEISEGNIMSTFYMGMGSNTEKLTMSSDTATSPDMTGHLKRLAEWCVSAMPEKLEEIAVIFDAVEEKFDLTPAQSVNPSRGWGGPPGN